MPQETANSPKTDRQWSPLAFAVTLTWGICLFTTLGLVTVLLVLEHFQMVSGQWAVGWTGTWCGIAISTVMLVAVRQIHFLERRLREAGGNTS